MSMIKPTVGRSLLFKPDPVNFPDLFFAAILCFVHSDRMVNLLVIDSNGATFPRTSVELLQDGDAEPSVPHAQWMPYQIGQAKAVVPEVSEQSSVGVDSAQHQLVFQPMGTLIGYADGSGLSSVSQDVAVAQQAQGASDGDDVKTDVPQTDSGATATETPTAADTTA